MGRSAGRSALGIHKPYHILVPLRDDLLGPYKMHDYRAGCSAEKLRGARDREDVSRFGKRYPSSVAARQVCRIRREATRDKDPGQLTGERPIR